MKPALLGIGAVVVLAVLVTAGGNPVGPQPGGGDDQIRAGTEAIANAIEAYAGAYGNSPTWDEVRPGGALAQFLDPWPANPLTGEAMSPGSSPGDFLYQTAIRMPSGEYRGYVTGYLSDGSSYPVEFEF